MKSLRRIICCLVLATLAAPAHADVPSLLPRVNVDLSVCFENLDDYPEYDFYLKYGLGRGNPFASLKATEMKSGVMTKLEGQGHRFTGAYLLAVPRGTPFPQPQRDNIDWLESVPDGGTQSSLLYLPETAGGSETTYRVHFRGKHLQVEYVTSSSLSSKIAWAITGTLLSVVIIFIGYVVVKVRRRRAASAKPLDVTAGPTTSPQ